MTEKIIKKYKTIYADPPWDYNGGKSDKHWSKMPANSAYETLKTETIGDIKVNEISDENSHLYLWVPRNFLKEGLYIMDKWGLNS